jgi:hypothetical protein
MPEERNNASVIDSSEDPWGIPPASVSWDVEPPFTVEGIITRQEMAQVLDFDSKKPQFWDDGRPRKKVIVTLQCKPDETLENDDGKRSIHMRIPSALFAAVREAIREAGEKTLPIGAQLSITYTGNAAQTAAEKKAKRSPAKEFAALIITTSDSDTSEPPF